MKAKFKLPGESEDEIEVELRWNASERFYVNGELVKTVERQGTDIYHNDVELVVKNHKVVVAYSVWPVFYVKVYVDDNLYIEELFPELMESLRKDEERLRAKGDKRFGTTKLVVMVLLIIGIFVWIAFARG